MDAKAKVSLVKCPTYNLNQLKSALSEALGMLGGISSVVRPGERVLIKPNLLSRRPAEEGVNTHPAILQALVQIVKEAQPAKILLGDSPGGYCRCEEVYKISGIHKLAQEEGVDLINFSRKIKVKAVPVSAEVLEVDKLISVPKFKTHNLTVFTAAVKNMYGIVPGLYKSEGHKLYPKARDFAKFLMDLFLLRPPDLSIIDAIIIMEGEGPAQGILRNAGLIAASTDSIALDAVMAALININPLRIPTLKEARLRNIGKSSLSDIEILGEDLQDCRLKNFKLPSRSPLDALPLPFINLVKNLVHYRAVIKNEICDRCEICLKSCPVEAINIQKDAEPQIDYKKCIFCMCCIEVCPKQAVKLKRSLLARLIGL